MRDKQSTFLRLLESQNFGIRELSEAGGSTRAVDGDKCGKVAGGLTRKRRRQPVVQNTC